MNIAEKIMKTNVNTKSAAGIARRYFGACFENSTYL
jgi:hypothetical protein